MTNSKYNECLFCFNDFLNKDLIKLKCNCYDYYYCHDCLFKWEQKKGKICPISWCKKKYNEEYFFFKKNAIFFKNICNSISNSLLYPLTKILLIIILINLLISQFKNLNNHLNSYIQ